MELPSSGDQATIQRFLMSIIASDLEWLQDSTGFGPDALTALEQKEILFDLASRRVAERCGRSGKPSVSQNRAIGARYVYQHLENSLVNIYRLSTSLLKREFNPLTFINVAMPEMTRTWIIPASSSLLEVKFDIREPPLTGDNLGLKTWGTSYVVAKKLEEFVIQHLDHLFSKSVPSTGCASKRSLLPNTKVLELGAGTGLVGIAAGAIWAADVYLTDLQDIAENLRFNVEKNAAIVSEFGGHIASGVLDWREPDKAQETTPSKKFQVSLLRLSGNFLLTVGRSSWLLILCTMITIQHS